MHLEHTIPMDAPELAGTFLWRSHCALTLGSLTLLWVTTEERNCYDVGGLLPLEPRDVLL